MNEVGTYRKKPIVVEAVRWPCDLAVLEEWGCEVAGGKQIRVWNDPDSCWKRIPVGHWILKGPAEGDFYPCAPEVFDATYETEQCALSQATAELRTDREGEKTP